jgi:hypothetical protein
MYAVSDFVALARDAQTSTTYKPALLKAIVRIQRDRERESVSLREIAEQFAQLYWTQTIVYHLRQAASLSKEPEVLQALRRAAAEAGTRRFGDLSDETRSRLLTSIAKTLKIDVLRRFHVGMPVGALPLFTVMGESVEFSESAISFVRTNSITLEMIANHWRARFLEKVNRLAPAIIQKIEADGIRRSSLRWFYDRIKEVDAPICFYCTRPFSGESVRHVDHFIPWSFLLADPVWDLVFACVQCNLSKSDRLPSRSFIAQLDLLNARRLTVVPDLMQRIPLPEGGIAQLYEAAKSVEWPNAWIPLEGRP